jgi:LSD1 subclass zinc finger protein
MAKRTPAPNPVEHPNPHVIPGETRTGGKMAACPLCDADVSKVEAIGGLLTCSGCARTLVLEKGAARVATAEDVAALPAAMQAQLRASRPAEWRAETTARLKQIRGREGRK